jgi:hypothetical protein
MGNTKDSNQTLKKKLADDLAQVGIAGEFLKQGLIPTTDGEQHRPPPNFGKADIDRGR